MPGDRAADDASEAGYLDGLCRDPPPEPIWDYRRAAAEAVQSAVRTLLSGA